jgi:hypothetical protein
MKGSPDRSKCKNIQVLIVTQALSLLLRDKTRSVVEGELEGASSSWPGSDGVHGGEQGDGLEAFWEERSDRGHAGWLDEREGVAIGEDKRGEVRRKFKRESEVTDQGEKEKGTRGRKASLRT